MEVLSETLEKEVDKLAEMEPEEQAGGNCKYFPISLNI